MRNDICFPCMENPMRCFLLSMAHDNDNNNHDNNGQSSSSSPPQQQHALSCNRQGILSASTKRTRTEEWCLIQEDADAGVFRMVHAATGRVLVCDYNGKLVVHKGAGVLVGDYYNHDDTNSDDSSFWSLEDHDSKDGIVKLRSFAGNCYLALEEDSAAGYLLSTTDNNELPTISTTPDITPQTHWKVAPLTGELGYLQLAHHRKQLLLCDNFGTLKLSSVWGGWEVWRLMEAGNNTIRISSWTHQQKVLQCSDYGVVSTTEDRFSDPSLWRVQKAPKGLDGILILHVTTGRLLRSDGKTLTTSGYIDGVNTTWQFTAAHRQRYYLSSIGYDKRISLIKEKTLKTTHFRRDCEVWCLEKQQHQRSHNNLITLKSQKFQRYLRYDGQGLSISEKNANDVTCHWRLVESPTGKGVCIVSAMEPYLALSCNAKGQLAVVDHQGPYESWSLEPVMPESLQQWQINLMVGGAVGAALLGPAVAVGMMGMGAEAAAAGATVVAAEAAVAEAAATGTAAAATATATLSVAGITAAIGTGAAVGLSATGIVVATSQRDRGEGTDLKQTEQDRPFCEWRNW